MNFDDLKKYTNARIGLGINGSSLPTQDWLSFNWHHARAKDAINLPWLTDDLSKQLKKKKINTITLNTIVKDRHEYILRPDYGCLLDHSSKKLLTQLEPKEQDILICASNGLSSLALNIHLAPLLDIVLDALPVHLSLAQGAVFLIPNARVGISDAIGQFLQPKVAIIFIGERPGLSSCDSLSAYLTYLPNKHKSNADRNCLSNIRPPQGLYYLEAAQRIVFLIEAMIRNKISGVRLKEHGPSLGK
jgi:ethanolamine ammonia-lyase small subunit